MWEARFACSCPPRTCATPPPRMLLPPRSCATSPLHHLAPSCPFPQVLIHNGASSIGLACIRIALSRGCEVFTTVSSGKKKRALTK